MVLIECNIQNLFRNGVVRYMAEMPANSQVEDVINTLVDICFIGVKVIKIAYKLSSCCKSSSVSSRETINDSSSSDAVDASNDALTILTKEDVDAVLSVIKSKMPFIIRESDDASSSSSSSSSSVIWSKDKCEETYQNYFKSFESLLENDQSGGEMESVINRSKIKMVWAGKEFDRSQKLSDRIGKSEKTKINVKLILDIDENIRSKYVPDLLEMERGSEEKQEQLQQKHSVLLDHIKSKEISQVDMDERENESKRVKFDEDKRDGEENQQQQHQENGNQEEDDEIPKDWRVEEVLFENLKQQGQVSFLRHNPLLRSLLIKINASSNKYDALQTALDRNEENIREYMESVLDSLQSNN